MQPNAHLVFLLNLFVVAGVALFTTAMVVILLRRADERRLHERKLEAVGTATARILHQIKNPLQTIMLHSEILEDPRDLLPASERREACRAISGEAERLNRMLVELSQWAAGSSRQLSPVQFPLDVLVRQLAHAAQAEGRVKVESEVSPSVQVLADGYYLQQAVENLIRNACEAMADQADARLRITLHPEADHAVLRVSDNGPGIPAERLREIFEPFVSSKGSGMGLGLAITKEIIEGHRGQIEAESRPGVGTSFRVSIPLSRDQASTAMAPERRETVLA
jgi:two-component system, NtrC family, sensor histidine kinase HydH